MLIGQYGRYIERPTFSALNPNRIQTSEYSYLIGNPMLRPTYINKFSITLVYNFRYTLTVGGNLHHDLIRQFGKEDAENSDISYVINENHNRENHWFVAITAPWQPLKLAESECQLYRSEARYPHVSGGRLLWALPLFRQC